MSSPSTVASPTSPSSSSQSDAPPARRRQRVSAEHTLNRVRENQRRHRARRKDYIASLEQKLAETEQHLAEARAEIAALKAQQDAHSIECKKEEFDTEHEMLAEEVLSGNATNSSETARFESVVRSPKNDTMDLTATSPLPDLQDTSLLVSLDTLIPLDLSLIPLPAPSPQSPSSSNLPGPPPCCEPSPTLPPPDPSDPECTSCAQRPAPLPTESTTLCAQAYVMIQQQNFRGIDAGTIRLWLYQGFRRAQRRGEGCRVENGALFRLLDYISGV